jgi:hypothetical protein
MRSPAIPGRFTIVGSLIKSIQSKLYSEAIEYSRILLVSLDSSARFVRLHTKIVDLIQTDGYSETWHEEIESINKQIYIEYIIVGYSPEDVLDFAREILDGTHDHDGRLYTKFPILYSPRKLPHLRYSC